MEMPTRKTLPIDPNLSALLRGTAPKPQPQGAHALVAQLEALQRSALASTPTPSEIEAEKLLNQRGYLDQQRIFLEGDGYRQGAYPIHQTVPSRLPFPSLTRPEIPNRPAPEFDPISSGLGLLAGLVDPQTSGRYGSAPLQSALSHAEQVYADRQNKFNIANQQAQQDYEIALQQRADEQRYLQQLADAQFRNSNADRDHYLQARDFEGRANLADSERLSARTRAGQEREAGRLGLEAQLVQQELGRQAALAQAQQEAAIAEQKRQDEMARALLGYRQATEVANANNNRALTVAQMQARAGLQQSQINTQSRERIANQDNQTRVSIANQVNQTRVGITNANNATAIRTTQLRNDALIKQAKIRASLQASGAIGALHPAQKQRVESAFRQADAAQQALNQAINSANAAYDTQYALLPESQKPPRAAFLVSRTERIQRRAQELAVQAEAVFGQVTGKTAPKTPATTTTKQPQSPTITGNDFSLIPKQY